MSVSTWIFMILTLVFYFGGFAFLYGIMLKNKNKGE